MYAELTTTAQASTLSKSVTPTPVNVPQPSLSPASEPSEWLKIKEGSQGPEVYALQLLLKFQGYGTTVDGMFSSTTRDNVITFQAQNGFTPDGVVEGNELWKALVEDAWVQKGDNGDHVLAVQYLLYHKFDYELTLDGDFGPQTDRTVRDFQKKHNLTVDGWVGPNTWRALISSPAP